MANKILLDTYLYNDVFTALGLGSDSFHEYNLMVFTTAILLASLMWPITETC